MSKVYFVGAGPGDPDLITVKGKRLLKEADVVIYAGSLVNHRLLEDIQGQLFDSAKMTLEEIIQVMVEAVKEGKVVVRLHSGDPSIYGAIGEQIRLLKEHSIAFEIVPGVSSAFAGAAALGVELTVPDLTQTVIFTRLEGRTRVPEKESLWSLAQHNATMVVFLSVSMAERVQDELLRGYPPETPVAIVEKASWEEERIIRCRLKELSGEVKKNNIQKTALIYVGEALGEDTTKEKRSLLYHRDFSHGFRE